jgi:hypothetical protein
VVEEMRRKRFSYLCMVAISASILFGLKHDYRHSKSHQSTPSISQPLSGSDKPALNIKSVVEHGHIVEIVADTEPGSIMMINGQQAAVVFGGYEARHFVGPLPDGVSNITVTVQKEDGSVNTQQVSVVLP